MKNKRLLYMLIALAILLGIIYVIDDRPDAVTFDAELCKIDRSLITVISIHSALSEEEISLAHNGEEWEVSFNLQHYVADQSKVNRIMGIFTDLEALRVVAHHESSWSDFQLDPEQASSVALADDSRVLCKIFTGSLTYDHTRNMSNTYVRMENDPKTYLVSDNLRALIQVEPQALISPLVSQSFQPSQVTYIQFSSETTGSLTLMHDHANGVWTNEDGAEMSSVKVSQYLRHISGLKIDEMATDYDLSGAEPTHSISLGFTDQEPLTIRFYATDNDHWHLTSSFRKDNVVFSTAGKHDLPDNLLKDPSHFIE